VPEKRTCYSPTGVRTKKNRKRGRGGGGKRKGNRRPLPAGRGDQKQGDRRRKEKGFCADAWRHIRNRRRIERRGKYENAVDTAKDKNKAWEIDEGKE